MKRRAALATSAALAVATLGCAVAAAAVSGAGFLGFQRGDAPSAESSAAPPVTTDAVATPSAPQGSSASPSAVVRVIEDRIVIASTAPTALASLDAVAGGSGRGVVASGRAAGANVVTPPPAPAPSATAARSHDDDREHEDEHEDDHDDEDRYEDGEDD